LVASFYSEKEKIAHARGIGFAIRNWILEQYVKDAAGYWLMSFIVQAN
jgi:hypothetical protein